MATPVPRAADAVFRHPALDFATVHTYAHGTIDDPKNTVAPAAAMAVLTQAALTGIADRRPYFDSEHGPIHAFKGQATNSVGGVRRRVFPACAVGASRVGRGWGGMRWPNRHPHMLTRGMHQAQRALAAFMPLIDWNVFDRRSVSDQVRVSPKKVAAFACTDGQQGSCG